MAANRENDVLDEAVLGSHASGAGETSGRPVLAPETVRRSGDFVQSRDAVWLKRNWADATFNFCFRATYPPLLRDYLAALADPFTFVDVGANQGLYAILAARNPACHAVLAFEPVCGTFAFLQANVSANPHADKIRLLRCAVSSHDGEATISVQPGHSGAASLRGGARGLLRRRETIATMGPASLAALRPASPAVIKVDVEGHERVVMQALADAGFLATARAVYYEVDTRWSDPGALEALLRALGFACFNPTGTGPHYDVLATRGNEEIGPPS